MLARRVDWKTLFGELTCQKKSCRRLCPWQSLFLFLPHRRCLRLVQYRHPCRIKYHKRLLSLPVFPLRRRIHCFRCRRLLQHRLLLLLPRLYHRRDLQKLFFRTKRPTWRIVRQAVSRQTCQSRHGQIVSHGLPAELSFWRWSALGFTSLQEKTRTVRRRPSLRSLPMPFRRRFQKIRPHPRPSLFPNQDHNPFQLQLWSWHPFLKRNLHPKPVRLQ